MDVRSVTGAVHHHAGFGITPSSSAARKALAFIRLRDRAGPGQTAPVRSPVCPEKAVAASIRGTALRPAAGGGTPTPTPTTTSTPSSSAWTAPAASSSGAPRACTRVTCTCSARCGPAASWRSAAGRRRARAGSPGRARPSSGWTCRWGCSAAGSRRCGAAVRGCRWCRRTRSRCRSHRPVSTSRARHSAAVPFVADSAAVMREVARVLRPGGRWVFAVNHPMRWIFLDDPGERGLVATLSYFDRSPYVEYDDDGVPSYVEHHRTLGDRVREIVAAGPDAGGRDRAAMAGGVRPRVGPVEPVARGAVSGDRDLRVRETWRPRS